MPKETTKTIVFKVSLTSECTSELTKDETSELLDRLEAFAEQEAQEIIDERN